MMEFCVLIEKLASGQDGMVAILPASFVSISLYPYRKWIIFVLMMALLGEIWATIKDLFSGPWPDVMSIFFYLTSFGTGLFFVYLFLRLLWKLLSAVFSLVFSLKTAFLRSLPTPPKELWATSPNPTPMKWNKATVGPMYYFFGFYVSAKDWDAHTTRVDEHFNEEVNRFKDWGNETMWYSYLQGVLSLNLPDVLVIFMPCATQERYMRRWQGLATYLHEYGIDVGLNMVEIVHSRGIAHLNSGAERVVVRNYVLHIPKDRTCVILDDVRTTGRSCADLAAAIKENGSHVIGAVVMAQVPRRD